jgi:hypothetical protein
MRQPNLMVEHSRSSLTGRTRSNGDPRRLERGEFDNPPGAGKPLEGLGTPATRSDESRKLRWES